ncbi:amino acid aminotransferase [Marinomonas sp. GJ51-6]|uniref:amino acid aminotransferase n=1 Tax=Marinomonas sp. GJ51-6 TaxID=2992802 RepID=UPI002935074D|nr:amino acid aminotransferase [Marinomonas sp. GJ51-6]WOD08618.1 amino acid aminotransferase [Marinomonas sp. GJ51-6]
MFERLTPAVKDPILSLSIACQLDTRANKLDLGVGVYRNEQGVTPVLETVKTAEQRLLDMQETKAYVGLAGCERFNRAMMTLLMGDNSSRSRAVAVQTPGASGALRMLADVIAMANPLAKVWMSDLSYANHAPIMKTAGLEVAYFPYFDPETKLVNEPAMLDTLATLGKNDVVLLHGCCHNPTGADLSYNAWQAITDLANQQGFLPFIDMAYQGFGDGMEEDAAGFRYLAERVPAYLVASSCSKNFGLYRERTGLAVVVADTLAKSESIKSRIMECARSTYTMPPDHGAAIVRIILEDEALKNAWLAEVTAMRQRIQGVRSSLADAIRQQTGNQAFDFIEQHKGMFSVLGTNAEQISRLKEEFGIYLVDGGRMNIAGLGEKDVPYLAESLAKVVS